MIQRTENTGKKKYVSCIKINGVPILPPLMTPEKQKSLLRYKQQAMKLEKRLKREQELRTYITKYYLGELTNDDDANSTRIINTLEQQLSFGDVKTAGNVDNDVPCVKQKNKASKLSCDLQVSQYINNEFALLKHSSSDCDTLRANSVVINLAEDYIEKDHAEDNELNTSSSKDDSPKPRLIRSNSFTIESPSPILLERLNRDFSVQQITDDKTEAGDVLNDSNVLLETERSSYDNNDGYTTCGSNCCLISGKEDGNEEKMNIESTSSCKSDYFHEHNNKSVVSCIDLSETGSDLEGKDVLEEQLPSNSDLNVLSSDFRFKEFISNNIPHTNIKSFPSEESDKKEEVFSDNESERVTKPSNRNKEASRESKESSFAESDVELKLKQMLDNILQMHSKEILELLQVQQHEQELRLDKYQTVKQALLDQSVPALKCDDNNSQDSQKHNSFWKETKCDTENSSSTFEIVNPFIESDKTENEHVNLRSKATTKEERAATVIGARVKGYLTRRLLRTDKVQGLIQTIKDTLICAVQLHTETTEDINESDVELHRRLIQQVSAACYAFHDVFFSLTVKEQMSIIKVDRQKQKEKLLRGTNVRTSDRSKSQSARKFSNHK